MSVSVKSDKRSVEVSQAASASGNSRQPAKSSKWDRRVVFKQEILDAYDSHFHIDRIGSKLGRQLTLNGLLNLSTTPKASQKVSLKGGTLVYCDPATYPRSIVTTDGWATAIGFHPRHAMDFSDNVYGQIKNLLRQNPGLSLGEIGLDRTEPKGTWLCQETVLKKLLGLAIVDQPIVLHVRGQDGDHGSGDVYSRCLAILRECIRFREQSIHLHCFGGLSDQVRQWRSEFPNTFFGFTGNAVHFSAEQTESLREVPDHRLLVETDSPYLSVDREVFPNTPHYIGHVAAVIATYRNTTVKISCKSPIKTFVNCIDRLKTNNYINHVT